MSSGADCKSRSHNTKEDLGEKDEPEPQIPSYELIGISTDYLSEIERGKKTPSFKRMELLAKALGIEVYKLFMPLE